MTGAVAFAAGVFAAAQAPAIPAAVGAGLAIAASGGAALYALARRRRLVTLRPLVTAVAAAVAAGGLGAARMAAWSHPAPDDVAHVAAGAEEADRAQGDRAPLTLWGRVDDAPTRTAGSIRCTVRLDSARRGAVGGAVSGSVQASLLLPREGPAPLYPVLRVGDRVRLAGRLEPLPRRRNPAQMDYGAYLRGQGVTAVVRIESPADVAFLAPSRRLDDRIAESARRRARLALARYVPDEGAQAVLLALLLADRSRVEAETLDAFRQTGLMHLLAVSGLHVFLVGLALYALLKPLLGRLGLARGPTEWTRTGLTLTLIGLYVLVTGASVSVVRAFVMAAVAIVGRTLGRRLDGLNALGGAALVLLWARPAALFEVGFQLSFSAVAALIALGPLLTAAIPERWRLGGVRGFVSGSSVATVAATLGTAPVLLVHFGRLPLGGLVLNLPAIPLTGATLLGGIGAVVSADVGWLARPFGAFASAAGRALLWTSEAGAARLGGIAYEGFLDSPWPRAAIALALGAGALSRRPRAWRRVALAAGMCLAVGAWAGAVRGDHRPHLDIVMLDVGQGDATLLRLPNGRHVLIDAGVRSPWTDQGARTVLPHLKRFGIDRLDALVLTHADADHVGGADTVLASVPVRRLIHNGQTREEGLWPGVRRRAEQQRVALQAVAAGDTLALDPTVRLRVLGPSPALAGAGDANEASVVLAVEYGATRVLLTGDAEHAGEAALVRRYRARLAADLVKVGHHGSRTSSTPAFVAAASGGRRPVAVVSVARPNRYGLPDEEPIARWAAVSERVVQTADVGAVWFRSDGQSLWEVDWR